MLNDPLQALAPESAPLSAKPPRLLQRDCTDQPGELVPAVHVCDGDRLQVKALLASLDLSACWPKFEEEGVDLEVPLLVRAPAVSRGLHASLCRLLSGFRTTT